ncbi:phage tail domain-containing protein [Lacticaseibacillus paracasei]|uniref:phage tail domain-containing protein n=1 Tax=Lacticaseibacillus paracasei TaxID=1597 RepID=UPI0031D35B5E
MDLLVEKLDGSRYYLSQYKVLITDFEESAPSVTRNSKQIDQRNGNIDFGGWHTDKTINITGYYRADDMEEEEMLREKLYALLSDPDGYYITQLKTTPSVAMERPGETSGGYYDKLSDYPSHKRFLVYTEAPEMELVGNVNGTLLYKLTAEFKTMKLPYGETPAVDVAIDSPYKDVPVNLLTGTSNVQDYTMSGSGWTMGSQSKNSRNFPCTPGASYTYSAIVKSTTFSCYAEIIFFDSSKKRIASPESSLGTDIGIRKVTLVAPENAAFLDAHMTLQNPPDSQTVVFNSEKLEQEPTVSPWSPNPADPEYSSWYYGGNVYVPYSGSVPCNQLEQGFTVQFTATGSASSLSFKIDDTELISTSAVAVGDVFMFSGFSYTQNGLSIVSKTNKAYFILQPDKPNRITCNVPGTVRIIGFQNLYA